MSQPSRRARRRLGSERLHEQAVSAKLAKGAKADLLREAEQRSRRRGWRRLLQDVECRLDHARAEGGSAHVAHDVRNGIGGHALAVGAVGPERVRHIRNREDASGG